MTEPLAPFDPELVEVDEDVHLVGVHCSACDRRSFPAREQCPWCGGTTSRTRLADDGTIVSFTVLHVPLAFHDAPTTVALVALADGAQVQGAVRGGERDDEVEIGTACRVAGLEISTPDGPRLAYCFEVPVA